MDIREAMDVCSADGHLIGTVERVEGAGFVADGQRLGFDTIERIQANTVYLWGNTTAYNADDTEAEVQEQREQSQGLPNTDARLYINARDVSASMEERMPAGPATTAPRMK